MTDKDISNTSGDLPHSGELEWSQLTLTAKAQQVEQLEAAFLAAGAIAVTLRDAADQPVLEPAPGETPLWPDLKVTGLFALDTDLDAVQSQLLHQLGADIVADSNRETLAEQDWERAWLEHYHPMRFGERLWVCPSAVNPPEPDAINLLLDPGLAFGTGTHPTTALCLGWLDRHDITNKTVIDYGCGSGILAIAAAKLGAQQVWAVDIDPQALIASRSNAELNQVDARLWLGLPEQLPTQLLAQQTAPTSVPNEDCQSHQVDIVVANILAGPIISLAPILTNMLRNGGDLVLAGLTTEQASQVQQAYATDFLFQANVEQDNWTLLHGVKRANPTHALSL